jgi:hypothetical protein
MTRGTVETHNAVLHAHSVTYCVMMREEAHGDDFLFLKMADARSIG